VLSGDTAIDILRRSTAKVEFDKASLAHDGQVGGKEGKDKRNKDQDFGAAVKQLMEEMKLLHRTANKMVTLVKDGGYSRAALRYTISKIDELVSELQACKEYLQAME
jgi:hypothetical protein